MEWGWWADIAPRGSGMAPSSPPSCVTTRYGHSVLADGPSSTRAAPLGRDSVALLTTGIDMPLQTEWAEGGGRRKGQEGEGWRSPLG